VYRVAEKADDLNSERELGTENSAIRSLTAASTSGTDLKASIRWEFDQGSSRSPPP
jgi:hypothetical protein